MQDCDDSVSEFQCVALFRNSHRGVLLFRVFQHGVEASGIPLQDRAQDQVNLSGVQHGGQAVDMVHVRVGGDQIVDMAQVQRFPDIGIHFAGGTVRTAVNDHGLAVAKDDGAVSLADVQEVYLQIRQRDGRQEQEYQDKRCNPPHGIVR